MWRLTPQALREGVKSTTRYRSKHPNKRGSRTQPLPQRQASGARGGEAARRSANLKREKRVLEYYHRQARSVPDAFEQERASAWFEQGEGVEYAFNDSGSAYTHHLHHHNNDNNNLELFPPGQPSYAHPAYVLTQSPNDSIFINSPTPSTDGPATPLSQGQWSAELAIGSGCVPFQDMDMGQEYAG
jgi:hypothetical protein